MHVCLTCVEFFGDSIFGGFGRSTRFIGRELARRGVRVTVVVPRRSAARPDRYEVEGMEVFQFAPHRVWNAIRLFRECGADIFHSQDASTLTFLARVAAPRAAHVVTFRDPMDRQDWRIETEAALMPRLGWAQYRAFIKNPLVTLAVRRADARYAAARFLIPKAARVYGLTEPPSFLPSPVLAPISVGKAGRPTVCWVGRWEARKRVELFFNLARQFPEVDFIAVGGARDRGRDHELRRAFSGIPNLRMTGVLDQFEDPEWSDVLGRSRVLINTSLREGLPTTFLEAAAHRCAILSFTDPEGFASRFGRKTTESGLAADLGALLEDREWRQKGQAAFDFVSTTFGTDPAMAAHLTEYARVLRVKDRRSSVGPGYGLNPRSGPALPPLR